MQILFFASVAEITGIERLELNNVANISELKTALHNKFPALNGVNYSVAVNQQISHDDEKIFEHDEIALLPPFSGG